MVQKLLNLILLLSLLSLPAWGIDEDTATCEGSWLMEVDELNLRDTSKNSNVAAVAADGSPDYQTGTPNPPAAYSVGYYMSLDSKDKASPTLFVIDEDNSWTCWIYPTQDVSAEMFLGEDDGDNYWALIDANTIRNQDDNSSDENYDWTGTVFEVDTWVHIAFTKDASSNQNMYADGVASDSNPNTEGGPTNIDEFWQGYSSDSYAMEGGMDEISYWSQELSSTDVNDIMDNGMAPAASPTGYGQII